MSATSRVEPKLDLIVAGKAVVADDVVELTLRDPSDRQLPAWEPGAHIDLVLGPDLVRQYSLCGDPDDRSCFRVAVLREPNGRGGSEYVHTALEVGESIRIAGPRNHFRLVDAKSYLFIAGGIGVTPIIPMVRAAAARGARWCLLYGGRTRASMAFGADLVVEYADRVALRPQDETGLLDLAGALDGLDLADEPAVYCCGPEALLLAAEQCCAERGIAVHVERFAPKAIVVDEPERSFEVDLAQSGTTVRVAADQTIVAALEAARFEVPTSCEEGTCGTCETRVLGGVPDHRDSLLTPEEQAANDTMMVCVSRANTPRLVLDL
ncbi:oxidoreductase [Nocardia nova]|uniref:Oxidoreductase n=1 Tax=Nocardia nova TaxID=37330 RepID=A0A2S6AVL8_9NOCA|nr:PDR/VanB family oxidoreductase [Nocardia nova]PPJ33485.1 oxidoreductase [Nocardia nova]PPJ39276.1 oxidoreductase [Nocardia nova]